jgi:eukaryotic-like serine/threonine-protein kinase
LWSDSDAGFAATIAQEPFPPTGDTITTIGHIGRYALKSRIGAGGLGTVYAAHDPLLSRPIAIKTLNLEISADEREAFNALFLNEARAAGGLSHPHIVTVFDAGISDNSAYIAMELLKGRDLRQLREEGWRPTPSQAALITRRVADALAYAHSKGVVHRDIKPANIFMVGRTQPRVLDFGIARVAHQHDGNAAGDVAAGSPYYMAPEQARMQPVDRRADVFSLGVVLYEMLADVKPFRGNSLQEITTAVLEHEPPLASVVDPRVPRALADIAAQAMAKDPDHRYRSARAFARELRHWLEENVGPDGGAATALPDDKPKRSRHFAAVAGVAVLGAATVWFAFSSQHNAAPAESVATTAAPAALPPVAAPPAVVPTAAAVAPAASTPAPAALPVAAVTVAAAPTVAQAAEVVAPAKPRLAAAVTQPAVREPPKESQKERRIREARDRELRVAAAKPVTTKPAVPLATGVVRIAVSPWGQVEVDGKSAGTTPPLNELTLPEGKYQITLRNEDFPAYSTTVNVVAGQPVSIKHKFGS